MSIRVYKPTSAGRRNASVNRREEVTKTTPERSLLRPKPQKAGRNCHGVITVRGRGGGVKRRYRVIDFKRRDREGIQGTVIGVEYDPNRSCHIALVEYTDGVKRYIVAPLGLSDGDTVLSSSDKAIEPTIGSCMPLRYIPTGMNVHCIELAPGVGGKLCRSAGSYARLTNKEGKYATIVMPSGELRRVPIDCRAVIGQVGNTDHQNRRLGKAGLNRLRGRRPKVRGVAMSHHEHPLGGGEGRSKSGRPPCSETGVLAKGGGTRNRKKHSQQLIIRRRRSTRYGLKK